MIAERFKYTMLLASLPPHAPDLLSTTQTPVSRIQLDKRLALLDARDAEDLQRIETLLHWSHVGMGTDEEIVRKSHEMLELINDDFLKNLICWRLELRTLISALRKRHAGMPAPEKNTFAGFGKWPFFITRNWHEPDFGIAHLLPWLPQARELVAQNKSYELEKLLLNLVWQHCAREGSQHYFDFPAVVIYVLRWNVINRWANYNAANAIERFDQLVDAELQDFMLDFGII
ncbi:MAG: DUF2764 family protein [Methylobacter sp.]|uniref:DUF2764 family protein n=1 Tax=Methylobacter sp. TaxID=2051955 RepID=UPI00258ED9DE|nr:DUF2764 family protein [Methylobacter sp.]MCL7421964.1 DUF2764 family protein [Methylobacter sp.]